MRHWSMIWFGITLVALSTQCLTAQSRPEKSKAVDTHTAILCKDGTLVTRGLPSGCEKHGGVDKSLRPVVANKAGAGNARPGAVYAQCKDATVEIDSPKACEKHGGALNRFRGPLK